MERSNKIGIKTYFFDKYIRNIKTKFSQVNSLKSLVKKCDVIFISYEDIFVFKKQRIFNQGVYVWDIFNFLSSKNIKKFSNKKEFNNLIKNNEKIKLLLTFFGIKKINLFEYCYLKSFVKNNFKVNVYSFEKIKLPKKCYFKRCIENFKKK